MRKMHVRTKQFITAMRSYSISRILVIVFLLALLPRVAITLLAPHPPSAHWDVAHDVIIARNLAEGNGFANEPGHPTAYRYPLIPLILSLFFRVFGERYIPFLLFQSILSALIAPIIAWIGYKAKGKQVALLAGILVAVNTELISYSRMMLTETLFSFLICLVALISIKMINGKRIAVFFSTGILLGLAALCRPVAIGWGILLAGILLLQKKYRFQRRVTVVLALTAGGLITVAPWLIRNQVVMGSPEFSTSTGITFWMFGHNDARNSDETTVIPEEFARVNREVNPREYFSASGVDPARMIPIYNMEPRYQAYSFEQSVVDRIAELDEVEANRELNSMALEYIRANPFKTLQHSVRNFFYTLTYTEMGGRMNIILTLMMPFLLLGVYRLWKTSPDNALIIISCLASMLVVHFLFYFDHRFRVPYQPFWMLLGAIGFLSAVKGNLSRTEKILFYGWMVVPVTVNYLVLYGNQSG
ncbi:MAG: glycosyltransferase family 39 protein [Candidatus Sabulitectum sp.]|nr:glycosyltransferase family 39 protein [Candidatus Sabulitectum sp.]